MEEIWYGMNLPNAIFGSARIYVVTTIVINIAGMAVNREEYLFMLFLYK